MSQSQSCQQFIGLKCVLLYIKWVDTYVRKGKCSAYAAHSCKVEFCRRDFQCEINKEWYGCK